MTVSLGGIALSDDLTLSIASAGVGISQRRLIGGASVVQTDGSSGGRTLILNSAMHLLHSAMEQSKAMQATGLPVTLVHHRGTFAVVIIDTSDLTPDQDYADPENDATATVSGNITLIEV